MTDDYPELTPFQYASNEPIANVDLDGLEALPAVTVTTYISKTASHTARAIAVNAINITSNVGSKVSEQANIVKWNASNRWNNFKQAVSDKLDDIKAGVEQAAYDEGKSVWSKWIEAGLDIDFSDPNSILAHAELGPIGRVKGLKALFSQKQKLNAEFKVLKKYYLKDYVTKNTKNFSAYFKSEREARNLARQKLGRNPIQVERNKFRSVDGKWQYRAKPGDVSERHIHLEELNPNTGEVLQNFHLRW